MAIHVESIRVEANHEMTSDRFGAHPFPEIATTITRLDEWFNGWMEDGLTITITITTRKRIESTDPTIKFDGFFVVELLT